MMERLTRKDKYKLSHGEEIVICKHDKQDCNDSCMKIQPCKWYKKVQDKLWEYENTEEQGLLLRLPCNVVDILYVNGILGVGEVEEHKVIRVDYHSNLATKRSEFYIEALLVSDPKNSIGFYDKEIGRTVFLTKEEAEQKLKEMESD